MSTPVPAVAPPTNNAASIITALGNAFKTQGGEPLSGDRIASLLLANMGQLGELAKQGRLNQHQIVQLKEYAEKHKPTPAPAMQLSAAAATLSQAKQAQTPAPPPTGFKSSSPGPILSAAGSQDGGYPISQTLTPSNYAPVPWASAQQGRPTLTGGIAGGRMSGTPAQVARSSDDVNMLSLDDNRTRRKNTPGDQSMRRSIQDLVSSIDPNVKIEAEVEDLLLDIADEFIDSVTNFGCRLAKHRGGDTLEVRDLQLHLERNHNIRIPGFASDETRLSLSQSAIGAASGLGGAAATGAPAKKGGGAHGQGTHMTLRSHRLQQVQQAKREAKLI